MRRRSPQALSEIIDDFLNEERHLRQGINEVHIIEAWHELLGPGGSRYTTQLSVTNGILYVTLSSSVLKNELLMMKEALLRRLNEHVGAQVISNIVFR